MSVTTREPEYRQRDLASLMASFDDEHAPRSSTGVLAADAYNPELQNVWQVPVRIDYAAQAVAKKQAEYRNLYGKDFDLSAYRFSVERADQA